MHLTGAHATGTSSRVVESPRWLPPLWSWVLVAAGLLVVYALDRRTGSAPVQHLYYLPIILAGLNLRTWGGVMAAGAAILLYHLANPHLLTARYQESDVVQMTLFVGVAVITAKLERDAQRLHSLAMTDDLTGLHNLRSFESRLKSLLRASRAGRTPISLLVLDVDRLKSLNDTHGHLTGAEAVRTVGQILAERLPREAVASRYGGDEFVVALPALGAADAMAIADDLRHAVMAAAPVLAGRLFPAATLSVSIGLASLDFDLELSAVDLSLDALGEAFFRAADRALYRAKSAGRNRVCIGRLEAASADDFLSAPVRS